MKILLIAFVLVSFNSHAVNENLSLLIRNSDIVIINSSKSVKKPIGAVDFYSFDIAESNLTKNVKVKNEYELTVIHNPQKEIKQIYEFNNNKSRIAIDPSARLITLDENQKLKSLTDCDGSVKFYSELPLGRKNMKCLTITPGFCSSLKFWIGKNYKKIKSKVLECQGLFSSTALAFQTLELVHNKTREENIKQLRKKNPFKMSGLNIPSDLSTFSIKEKSAISTTNYALDRVEDMADLCKKFGQFMPDLDNYDMTGRKKAKTQNK